MLHVIEKLLDVEELRQIRRQLDAAPWRDGGETAGAMARGVKQNLQLDDSTEPAVSLAAQIMRRLGGHPLFISAALPRRIYPPKFNRYTGGGTYGAHVDSAVLQVPGTGTTMRSDLSATLFLCAADEYDGGELQIESPLGMQSFKLGAGDLLLYPSGALHRVTPVTRGARIASFFWVESLVADAAARSLLFELDQTIQKLTQAVPDRQVELLSLSGTYHNLLRRWAKP
ncbi:MAG: Fe2+-dependent dioxygenase [Gammaproteobacteria bacterium]|nr:Fe2+-dependent dioxygenase [Gammaproteobacteria bacterium]